MSFVPGFQMCSDRRQPRNSQIRDSGSLTETASFEAVSCLRRIEVLLELKLRLELNDSGRSVGTQARAVNTGRGADRRYDLAEVRGAVEHDRKVEVRVVEEVEEPRSQGELRGLQLGQPKAFSTAKSVSKYAGPRFTLRPWLR